MRISTLAKLQHRRTHDVRPSDGKARIGITNEYMHNVLQSSLVGLYSSHSSETPMMYVSMFFWRNCNEPYRRSIILHTFN
jgi:hypothetical protein